MDPAEIILKISTKDFDLEGFVRKFGIHDVPVDQFDSNKEGNHV